MFVNANLLLFFISLCLAFSLCVCVFTLQKNEANPPAPAYPNDNGLSSRVAYYQLPPIVMTGTDLPTTRTRVQNDNIRNDDFHTAYHAYRNDNKHINAHAEDYPSHQPTPPLPDSPRYEDNRHLGSRSDRSSSGYLLFCADQRSNRAADAQAPDDSILDRRWQELPQVWLHSRIWKSMHDPVTYFRRTTKRSTTDEPL